MVGPLVCSCRTWHSAHFAMHADQSHVTFWCLPVQVCVASGKLIKDMSTAVCCKTCKQYTSYAERQDKDICALCHTQLPLGSSTSLMTSLSYLDTDMEE